MNDRCPRCGAMVLENENFCPQCGVPLREAAAGEYSGPEAGIGMGGVRGAAPYGQASAYAPETGAEPRTLGELKAFCAYHGMPLEKMRFFVGVDYRQPRAFGVYRDGDQFVVYKNKDDGSRAVRYHGPDEAHAVKELFDKLLDECHRRNIWPGGKPKAVAEAQKRSRRRFIILVVALIIAFAAFSYFAIRLDARRHAHDGYYAFDDSSLYYRYGDSWYYDDPYYDWILYNGIIADGYDDYYLGSRYDADWGYSDFETSPTWDKIQEDSRTDSSDYDSWDSGGTDWSSDW